MTRASAGSTSTGQEAPAAEGASVLRSPTFGAFFFYRVFDIDPAKAEALKKGEPVDGRDRFFLAMLRAFGPCATICGAG